MSFLFSWWLDKRRLFSQLNMKGESELCKVLWFKFWAFSIKTFQNLEIAANGTEISRKSFRKFRKLLNFRNANHLTENSRSSGSNVEGKKTSGKKLPKIWVSLARFPLFENFEKCCSIRHWKLPKIQTGRQRPLSQTETYPSAITNIVGPSSGIVLSVWTCLFDVLKEPIIWASGSTERVQKKFSGPLASL